MSKTPLNLFRGRNRGAYTEPGVFTWVFRKTEWFKSLSGQWPAMEANALIAFHTGSGLHD